MYFVYVHTVAFLPVFFDSNRLAYVVRRDRARQVLFTQARPYFLLYLLLASRDYSLSTVCSILFVIYTSLCIVPLSFRKCGCACVCVYEKQHAEGRICASSFHSSFQCPGWSDVLDKPIANVRYTGTFKMAAMTR